jgi:hypothetical protein
MSRIVASTPRTAEIARWAVATASHDLRQPLQSLALLAALAGIRLA